MHDERGERVALIPLKNKCYTLPLDSLFIGFTISAVFKRKLFTTYLEWIPQSLKYRGHVQCRNITIWTIIIEQH